MTDIEICNAALATIGHDRKITGLSDGSTEAVRCALFYPIARDKVLGDFAWEWAMKSASVSANTDVTLPADLVRVVDVIDSANNPVRAVRSANKIRADKAGTLRYVSNSVSASAFPQHVTDAIVHELAYRLYAPMYGNANDQDSAAAVKAMAEVAAQKLDEAKNVEIEEHAFMGAMRDPESVSKTDIANRALSAVGAARTIRDLATDTSEAAVRCRQLLPMAIRRVLSEHRWEFAEATVTASSSPYTLPTDFTRLVSVRNSDGQVVPARIENGRLVFSGTNLAVRYITSNVSVAALPPHVADAVTFALAQSLVQFVYANSDSADASAGIYKNLNDQYQVALASAVGVERENSAYRQEPQNPEAASRTDIANRALSMIGSGETVRDLDTDDGETASRVRALYKTAVAEVLTSHGWDFASAEKDILLTSVGPDGYSRTGVPDGCFRIVSVNDAFGHPLKYRRTGNFIFVKANGDRAVIRYLTDDFAISDAPAKFREAVIYTLAALVAPGSGMKDAAKTAATMFDMARVKISDAESVETDETAYRGEWENPFLKARRS